MLQVGIGIREITPPVGLPLGGFIARQNRPATHIDSPLHVRCLAVQAGGTPCSSCSPSFLFNFDLLGISAALEAELLARLEAELGADFSRERCLLTATHTHSAPVVMPLSGEAGPAPGYLEYLSFQTLEAARLSLQSMQPANLYTATVRLAGLTYNRRALLIDGRVSISPHPDMPVIERGPVDDRLTVLAWCNAAGETLAAVAHFACHGVAVLSQAVGADIPGELAGRVGAALGGPCLFLQGAAGDINPTTVTAGRADLLAWVEKAAAGLEGLRSRLRPIHQEPLRVIQSELSLEYAQLPDQESAARQVRDLERIASGRPEELEAADLQETLRAFKNTLNLPPDAKLEPATASFVARALAAAGRRRLAASVAGGASPAPLRLAAWRLGGTVLVFVAAEVFSSTGLRIRALRSGLDILPVSYLAPLTGYLPDRAALAQGGYEVNDAWRFYGHPAPFREETEERMVLAIDSLLTGLE